MRLRWLQSITQAAVLVGAGALVCCSGLQTAAASPHATVTVYPTYSSPTNNPTPSASASVAPLPVGDPLTNLVKHSKPGVVKVSIYDASGQLVATGSGFFVSSTDLITNCHVVNSADHADVKTSEGEVLPVLGVTAYNRERDIARLRVTPPRKAFEILKLRPVEPESGEHVLVIGAPLGLEQSVSDGIVSAVRDFPGQGRVIQITAPVSPGNSGGPVMDMAGNVIGVVDFQSREGQNLNFAIPAEVVTSLKDTPLARLTEWNAARPAAGGVSSTSAAAQACHLFFQALGGHQYRGVWAILTPATQRAYVSALARSGNMSEAQARSVLDGSADSEVSDQFWGAISNSLRASEKAIGTYTVQSEEGNNAIIGLTDATHASPMIYVMVKDQGVWKIGLIESAELTTRSH